MKRLAFRVFLCLSLFSMNAYAVSANEALANSHPGNAIHALMLAGDLGGMSIHIGSIGGAAGQYVDDVRDMRQALDDRVEAAVVFSKGKPDLIKAVKDYYQAASAFLANGIPTNRFEKMTSDRLQADMDAKQKSVNLEMKLAGIK